MVKARATPYQLASHDSSANRVRSLSDGVSAVVVTLLVLEPRVPEMAVTLGQLARTRPLTQALAEVLPRVIVAFVTFLVAGMGWLIHARFQT
ncbi:TMEM175 family protein [Deinococcus sp. SM5_A1]|uniref:TMEM175 family protein n=1 Tax=Deinococcus sp. SM5_A1 TaxID=3379094 RepID=UPI00385E8491